MWGGGRWRSSKAGWLQGFGLSTWRDGILMRLSKSWDPKDRKSSPVRVGGSSTDKGGLFQLRTRKSTADYVRSIWGTLSRSSGSWFHSQCLRIEKPDKENRPQQSRSKRNPRQKPAKFLDWISGVCGQGEADEPSFLSQTKLNFAFNLCSYNFQHLY